MRTEKKCPTCGVWTTWEKQPTDSCTSCNQLLDPIAFAEKTEREEGERIYTENNFLRIRDTDSFWMRVVRRIAWFFHIVFATIAWGFLWMVTTFSG